MKKFALILLGVLLPGILAGCGAALVGAGATGGYVVGTEERTVGDMWDDASLNTQVKYKLLEDASVSGSRIDVDTYQREVILSGVVDTDEEARRAIQIARSVPGVRTVKNNLQVGEKSIGDNLDDTVIFSRIKSGLVAEPGIRSLNIDVDVDRGVVTLSGIVGASEQKDRIINIARTTPGTVRVVDNLKISTN